MIKDTDNQNIDSNKPELVTFESVKDISTEDYFNNNTFSVDAFNKKYSLFPGETYLQSVHRVCTAIASVEDTPEKQKYWAERWFDEIYNDWWHPAGSIMQGAGSGKNISLANCFAEETEFITSHGVKSFKDFNDGDVTSVLTKFGAFNKATVKKFGTQRLFKLTLKNKSVQKEIFCTEEHLWNTKRKSVIVTKPTKELSTGDLIPFKNKKWSVSSVNHSRYWCPIGFIHGLTFGDGYYVKSDDYCSLDLCGDSVEYIKFFNQGLPWKIKYESDQKIRIQYLPSWFKSLPDLTHVNSEYLLGFIVGWIAADGYIDPQGRTSISSCKVENLEWLFSAAQTVGIYGSSIRLVRTVSPFNGEYAPLYDLYLRKNSLFSSLFVKEKHINHYQQFINNKKNQETYDWHVVSVEETDRIEEVWCVQEPITESFILEGGVETHNCSTTSLGAREELNNWDNLESIIRNCAYTVAKSAAFRQGQGIDFSALRPRGMSVQNSAREGAGAVHWMKFIDSIGYYVGQCLSGDTQILTIYDGIKTIKEIVENKYNGEIYGLNGPTRVINWFKNPIKKLYTITSEYGDRITCSEDHKIYVFDGTNHLLKPLKNISSSDWIVCKRNSVDNYPEVELPDFQYFGSTRDLYAQKIKSIEYTAEEATYDITVSDQDHIYCANTFMVSNSGRIPALLISLRVDHPDVIEFIKAKSDYTTIQNANISVQCTDAFYQAVENDEEWEMSYTIPSAKKGDKIYLDVHSALLDAKKDDKGFYVIAARDRKEESYSVRAPAREILELIAKGMCDYAEPGVQNIDTAIRESNSDYVYDPLHEYDSRILSTNACSEQYLSRDSLCILSSINMGKFSGDKSTYKLQLEKIATSMNRFLDNVNEHELIHATYATPHQKMAIEHLRRTGAGFTNLEAWLFKQNLAYGSNEGNDASEEFQKWYNYYLYRNSIELGKEKGNFKSFNREKLEKSPFIQRMISLGLEFTHLRNITCSSIAPTGSLSLLFRDMVMSYGIEKGFGAYYWKRTRISGKYEYYFNVPSVVRETFEKAGCPIPIESDAIKDTWDGKLGKPIAKFIDDNMSAMGLNFRPSTETNIFEKLDLMCKVQKWVDSSLSTTYMLPEDANWKDVYDFILKGWKMGLKSIAAYPDRKMYGIVSYIPFKDLAIKLIEDKKEIHHQNFSPDELRQLSMPVISKSPKWRPKEVEGELCTATARGKKFLFFIGIVNGRPFEMFGGEMPASLHIKDGKASMVKEFEAGTENKFYSLKVGDIVFENFGSYFTSHEESMFRAVSYMLQNGDAISRVAKYLKGCSHREGISSLYSAARRVLLKYDTEDKDASADTSFGKPCPLCNSANVFNEAGCIKCLDCGWSKCE